MMNKDIVALQEAIKKRWETASGPKVQRYVGKFWNRNRRFHELGATKLAVLWVLDNLGG